MELQIVCYPTLADSSRFKAAHFESHLRIFPAEQWVALDGERVGMSAGFLYTFDFAHPHHSFDEIIDYGFFTRHDPQGQHFYGADVSVHPITGAVASAAVSMMPAKSWFGSVDCVAS